MQNSEIALQLTLKAMEMNFGREPMSRAEHQENTDESDQLYINSTIKFFHAMLKTLSEAPIPKG